MNRQTLRQSSSRDLFTHRLSPHRKVQFSRRWLKKLTNSCSDSVNEHLSQTILNKRSCHLMRDFRNGKLISGIRSSKLIARKFPESIAKSTLKLTKQHPVSKSEAPSNQWQKTFGTAVHVPFLCTNVLSIMTFTRPRILFKHESVSLTWLSLALES